MKIAIVLSHGGPSSASRIARGHARQLAAAGISVDLRLVDPSVPDALDPWLPLEGPGALRAGARYDVAIALGWEAFYAMFALEAASYLRLVIGDERRGEAEGAARATLIERSYAEPGVGLIADHERRRAWLSAEHSRDARVAPSGVDLAAFTSRQGRGRPPAGPVRVLIEGAGRAEEERVDLAHRVAAQVAGVEVWHVASDGFARPEWRAARRLGQVPLDAMPEVYRSCDVLLKLSAGDGASLTPLEMMAAGGAVVVARPEERRDFLRHEENALVTAVDDEAEAVRALRRVVEDAALRVRLGEGGAATAAALGAASTGPGFPAAVRELWAESRALPPGRRRELAAIGDLLRSERAARARALELAGALERSEPWPRALVSIGRRAARRAAGALSRLSARPRPGGAPGRGAAGGASLRPGEPVIFAGQPRYFRSAYHDAVLAGWGIEAPLRPGDRASADAFPGLAERHGAGTCVIFEPDLAVGREGALRDLRARGVRVVGYSSEPVPRAGAAEVHWDQLRRLGKLRRARDLGWDLLIHFDPTSADFLRAEGFSPIAASPLPVSEALFFPEEVERDFDVCFLGRSTPRRESFLGPLEGRFRVVHVAHGLFDEDARRLMNRSRVVVNLHCHEYPSFENRAVHALFCGRPLVSEELSAGLLVAGRDYRLARTPDDLVGEVAGILRGERAGAGADFDRTPFRVAALRDLLSAAREGALSRAAP